MYLLTHALTSNIEVRAWASNYIPLFKVDVITYACHDLNLDLINLSVKGASVFFTTKHCKQNCASKFQYHTIHIVQDVGSIDIKFGPYHHHVSMYMSNKINLSYLEFYFNKYNISSSIKTWVFHHTWPACHVYNMEQYALLMRRCNIGQTLE